MSTSISKMPKREKKSAPKKNNPNSRAEKLNNDSNGTVPKKKCLKPNPEDSITKSKKLSEKLKNTKLTTRRSGRPSTCKDESRICGNGKPMPSLADLEKMFEDSDNDEEHKIGTPKKSKPDMPQMTPEKPIVLTEDKLTSPGTIKKLADKMMDLISNLPDPILIDEGPPTPIIPPKKRKKPEVPYIVGCKDRPQIPEKPSVNFCKGDDYGIELNKGDEDDECPKKRAKRTKAVNLSKSVFNAKSDEIAAWLKDIDKAEQSDGSSDSNKTVEYEIGGGPRSFSPLPSTSKDNEIISQNDKRFIDSLVSETISEDSVHSVCSIVDNTNATIIIDDDEVIANDKNKVNILTDDCVEVIDVNFNDEKDNMKKKTDRNCEIILDEEDDDCYKFIYTDVYDANVPEIIDVDAVIAENKAIIEKYSKVEKLNSVTHVDSSTISALDNNASVNNKTELNTTDNLENALLDSNANIHEDILPVNSTANQIQRIVKNFFQCNTMQDTANSKSRFEDNNNCDLFTNFATWIKSFNTIQSNSRAQTTEVRNAHVVTNEIIEIDDNYIPTVNISDNITRNRRTRRDRTVNPITPGPVMPTRTQNRNTVLNRVPVQQNTEIAQPAPVQPPPVQNSSPARKSIGDCPICMDNLANNSVASTTCGHVFCMECIKAAVKANGKRCPTCRKALKGIGFHQLFL